MNKVFKKNEGQTLIETVVAIFILTTGIGSLVGLTVYSFNASRNVTKQIIAAGLAREAVEAVKNMRDTNWLQDPDGIRNNCYNFVTGNNTGLCYKKWLNAGGSFGYNIDPGSSPQTYVLDYTNLDKPDKITWMLTARDTNFGLNFNKSGSPAYYTSNVSQSFGSSDFYRQVELSKYTASPYDQPSGDTGPMLVIKSRVWWTDRLCPRSATWPGTGKCAIEMQMNLTNWKDF